MRLFTGIALAPASISRIAELLDPLKPRARLQWTAPGNFHITTKFLGEWPGDRLQILIDALQGVPSPAPFTLHVERLGFFPNADSPRVFWAGVRAPQPLAQLAHQTDLALTAVGVPRETRAYSPHVTLARIKPTSSLTEIRDLLAQNASASFGATEVTAFHLYFSRPAPGGSVYEKLSTFALQ